MRRGPSCSHGDRDDRRRAQNLDCDNDVRAKVATSALAGVLTLTGRLLGGTPHVSTGIDVAAMLICGYLPRPGGRTRATVDQHGPKPVAPALNTGFHP